MIFQKLFWPILTTMVALGALSVAHASDAKSSSSASKPTEVEIASKKRFHGDVIFLRGGFNVFSKGLDQMAEKLGKKGINVRVISYKSADSAYQSILKNRKKYGRKPIVLVGHSWGANAAIEIAKRLKKKKIRVSYMATFAATNPGSVPSNVKKATNYYFKTDGWGKPIQKDRGARVRLKNIDLSETEGVHHFNIEQNPRLQRQVIGNVIRFVKGNKRA